MYVAIKYGRREREREREAMDSFTFLLSFLLFCGFCVFIFMKSTAYELLVRAGGESIVLAF